MSGFVTSGLDPAPYAALYGLADAQLAERGAERMTVTEQPGFPCRVTLEDARVGETVLLLNHEHLGGDTPYRQRHAIFIREGATAPARFQGAVPDQLAIRLLSVRAYDAGGRMTDADVIAGTDLAPLIDRFFDDSQVAFIHAHNAKRGCFAARIDRR